MIFGEDLAGIVLGGLAAGMVLFIVSVGLSVTMGLMGFVNLAHGGFAMIGGYVIVLSMNRLGVPFIPAIILGFVLTAAFSVVLERLFYSKLYRAAELDQVLFSIGLAFVMIASVIIIIGPGDAAADPAVMAARPDGSRLHDISRTYSIFLIVVGAIDCIWACGLALSARAWARKFVQLSTIARWRHRSASISIVFSPSPSPLAAAWRRSAAALAPSFWVSIRNTRSNISSSS